MLISILVFLVVPIVLKIASAMLGISFRKAAKSLILSLSMGLISSSLTSSLVYLVSPSFRWEDLPFLIPVLAVGSMIFGTYAYARFFEDQYVSALGRNIFSIFVTLTIAVLAYVLLLVARLV